MAANSPSKHAAPRIPSSRVARVCPHDTYKRKDMRIKSKKFMDTALTAIACLAGLAAPMAAQACATCGCSLSTDAAMGYSAMPGWRVNLDYSFIPQNQLRSGSGAVSPTQAAAINAAGGSQEVEHQTINRYVNLGISYSPNSNWNFSAIVPYIDRSHTTYSNATPDQLTSDSLDAASPPSGDGIHTISSGFQDYFVPSRSGFDCFLVRCLTPHRYDRSDPVLHCRIGQIRER